MAFRWTSPLLAAAVLLLGACDATGPDRGNTRVLASSLGSGGATRALIPAGPLADRDDDDRGPRGESPALALVEDLTVTITAVQALPAQHLDRPHSDRYWETLTLASPVVVPLLDLPEDPFGGVELFEGDLPPGAYVRMRFLVSEMELTLAAPLQMGRRTFPADEPIEIHLPDPWVQVPGAYFTVSDDEIADVRVYFDPAESFGRLVVGKDGRLVLAPVVRGRDWDRDRDRD